MPLEEQTVEIPFDGGTKEGEEPLLQTEGFADVQNCYQEKDGGLRKLFGFALSDPGAVSRNPLTSSVISVPTAAQTLADPKGIARANIHGIANKGTLWTDVTVTGATGRVPVGYLSEWVAEQETITTIEGFDRFDVCAVGDIVYYAHTEEGDTGLVTKINVLARKLSTGETLYHETMTASGGSSSGARLVPWQLSGHSAMLLYRDGTDIKWAALQDGRLTGAAGTVWSGLPTSGQPFDAVTDIANGKLYFAVAETTSSVRVTVWTLAPTVTGISLDAQRGIAQGDPITAVSLCHNASTGRLLLSVGDWFLLRNRVTVQVLNATTLLNVNPALIMYTSSPASIPDSTAFDAVIKQITATVAGNNLWYVVAGIPNQSSRGGIGGPASIQYTIGSKLESDGSALQSTTDVIYNARVCSRAYFDATSRRVYFLAHLTRDSTVLGDPNRAVIIAGHPGLSDTIAMFGAGRLIPFGFFGYLTAQTYGPESGRVLTGFFEQLASWYLNGDALHFCWRDEENSINRIRDVALKKDARVGVHQNFGASTYIAGAMLWQWDGWRTFEAQFLQQPYLHVPTPSEVAGAGGLTPGPRQYKVTFARVNANGEVTRSRPSDAATWTTVSQNVNAVIFNRINVTAAQEVGAFEELYYEVWRTKVNQASPFYLVARLPAKSAAASGGTNQICYYTRESFLDGVADSALSNVALAPDGSAGAELANDPPCSAAHLCTWSNRLWVTDGESIWYSKERAPDRSAEFSGLTSFGRGAIQGRIVGIARSLETLAVFSPTETGAVFGEPAAANGSGSTLFGPVLQQGTVGCLYPSALCDIPIGTLVPTQFGVQLYTLSRQYEPIGVDAESQLSVFQGTVRVKSAVYEQSSDLAWICADRMVLFDVARRKWSTAFNAVYPVSIVALQSGILAVTSDTQYGKTRTATGGWGSPGNQIIETPWFKAGGVLGEMRVRKVWLLMQNLRNVAPGSSLSIYVYYDYTSFPAAASMTFSDAQLTSGELYSASNLKVIALRIPMPRQRCRSFKLRIVEGADGSAFGFRFLALRIAFANRGVRGTALKESNSGGGL